MGIGRDLNRIVGSLPDGKFAEELRYVTRAAHAKAAIAEREEHRVPLPCRTCGETALPRSPYCEEHDWTR